MKNIAIMAISLALLAACSEDKNSAPAELEAVVVSDLNALGKYTFYNLRDNTVSTDSASTSWDIGFYTPTMGVPVIIANGGTSGPGAGGLQIVDGVIEDYETAPPSGYGTTPVTSGWYTYTGSATTGPQHAVFPITGKLIIVKTADGKYVKIQVVSIYQGNPDTTTAEFADLRTRPSIGYWTFRFIVQPDGSTNF